MKFTLKNTIVRFGVTLFTILFALSAFLVTVAFAQEQELSITDVQVIDVDAGNKSATITWKTNALSQSIVVCGNATQAPFEFDIEKKNFGYTWSTIILGGVTLDHRVPLAQLAPETHHCRVASRFNENSPWVVSKEITFTTGDIATTATTNTEAVDTWNEDINRGEEVKDEGEAVSKDSSNSEMCRDSWTIWALVLIALLIATLWSKEVMEKITSSDSVRRLYVLGGAGLIVFLIALLNSAGNWIVPIGIGTMAIIAATIVDVVRSEGATAYERLGKIITTLLVSLLVAFVLAIFLNWTCAVTPIAFIAIALGIRHYLFNKEEEKEEEVVESRIIKTEEKEEEDEEEDDK